VFGIVNRDFFLWIRQVRSLTLGSVLASLATTLAMGAAVAAANRLIREPSLQGSLTSASIQSEILLMVVAILIALTIASVLQSLSGKLDALLVRSRMRQYQLHAPNAAPRQVMAERFLMEQWSNWISLTVQVIGFSLIMIGFGNLYVVLGIGGALLVTWFVGRAYFEGAFQESLAFLHTKQEITRASVRRPGARSTQLSDDFGYQANSQVSLSEAVYKRDSAAFRISVGKVALLSGVTILLPLAPLGIATVSSLPAFLIVLVIWRQRVIDMVRSLGVLAWTLALWSTGSQSVRAHEEEIF
jgi:hypothetical protein